MQEAQERQIRAAIVIVALSLGIMLICWTIFG
jgi:hypothetical protein